MALLRGGGYLRHPGTFTYNGSQASDECNSHDWQIIATKLWICGMCAVSHVFNTPLLKCFCEITFDDINFVKHRSFFFLQRVENGDFNWILPGKMCR